jgi:hypothetical protein
MEVRGLGLIDVQAIFGVSAVCAMKTVGLVVQLERWDPTQEYDRLGLEDQRYDLAGREGAARADAGRPRPQHRHAGRSGGPQRAAQGAGLSRRENADRALGAGWPAPEPSKETK